MKDLVTVLKENNISCSTFETRIFKSQALNSMMKEQRSWNELNKRLIDKFKIVYAWIHDEQRLLKLNEDTDSEKPNEVQLEISENQNQNLIDKSYDQDIEMKTDHTDVNC